MVKGDAPLSGEHKFFHKVKYNLAIHNQLNESVTRGSDVHMVVLTGKSPQVQNLRVWYKNIYPYVNT